MTVAEVGVHDIKRVALRGGLAKLISQAGNSALRFGFLIVAARLLEPKDFGLVAMVTVFTAVLDLFSTAGLSSATVQKSTVNTEQISTLFWINILVGVTLSIVCVLIAPLVVAFYHEPRLFWVTVVMGAGFIFNAAGVQHLALLQRQMRYATLAIIEFSCQLATFGLALCLALDGYGYWALVAAAIALPAAMTISTWTATGWIPGLPKRKADIRSMLHFGGTLTLNGVVSYVTVNFDKFLVGRVWGATALGNYSVAAQLITTPVSHLNLALGGVTFSALSRLQNDAVRFRSYFLKGYALNVSLTLPIIIFSAVFANDIVLVALGQKWADAAIIFQMLAPAVLFIALVNPLVWVLFASHRHVRSLLLALVIAVARPHRLPRWLALRPAGHRRRLLVGDDALAHSPCRLVLARNADNAARPFPYWQHAADLCHRRHRAGLCRMRLFRTATDAAFPACARRGCHDGRLRRPDGPRRGKGLLPRSRQSDAEYVGRGRERSVSNPKVTSDQSSTCRMNNQSVALIGLRP